MKIEDVIPPLRDITCLVLGGYSGYQQITGTTTWEGIALTLLLLGGPGLITAYWLGRTQDSGSPGSPPAPHSPLRSGTRSPN